MMQDKKMTDEEIWGLISANQITPSHLAPAEYQNAEYIIQNLREELAEKQARIERLEKAVRELRNALRSAAHEATPDTYAQAMLTLKSTEDA